jgi:hypothetical protein
MTSRQPRSHEYGEGKVAKVAKVAKAANFFVISPFSAILARNHCLGMP